MRGYFPVLFLLICFLTFSGTGSASGKKKAAVTILPSPVSNGVSNSPSGKAPQTESGIELKDGLVSVNVRNETLSNVLSRLGQKAGFTFSIYPALLNKKVTTSFSALPLEYALRRILTLAGAKNYRIIYGDDGRLAALKIFGESKPRAQTVQTFPRYIEPGSRAVQIRQPRVYRPRVSPAPPHAPSGEENIPDELLQDPSQEPSGDVFTGGH